MGVVTEYDVFNVTLQWTPEVLQLFNFHFTYFLLLHAKKLEKEMKEIFT